MENWERIIGKVGDLLEVTVSGIKKYTSVINEKIIMMELFLIYKIFKIN